MSIGGRRLGRGLVALVIGLILAGLAVLWLPWVGSDAVQPPAGEPDAAAAPTTPGPGPGPGPGAAPERTSSSGQPGADGNPLPRLAPESTGSAAMPPGTRVKIDAPVVISHTTAALADQPRRYRVMLSVRTTTACELVALELRALQGVRLERNEASPIAWHDLPAGSERAVALTALLPPDRPGGRIAVIARTRSLGRDLATAHSVRVGQVELPQPPIDDERGEVMLEATVE